MTGDKNLEGLGGWLVLVGFGIIISPLKIIAQVYLPFRNIFSDGSWEVLTTPGTEVYNSMWAPLLIGEMTINSGMILAWIYVAFLFFTKKKEFPKWYIGIFIFSLSFILTDALAYSYIAPNEPIFDAETTKLFGSTLVATLIWVPYMLVSKRVKSTFIN